MHRRVAGASVSQCQSFAWSLHRSIGGGNSGCQEDRASPSSLSLLHLQMDIAWAAERDALTLQVRLKVSSHSHLHDVSPSPLKSMLRFSSLFQENTTLASY